jgi:hypothetical protein
MSLSGAPPDMKGPSATGPRTPLISRSGSSWTRLRRGWLRRGVSWPGFVVPAGERVVRMKKHAGDPTYQTVRLVSGKHFSPREGVCVMELPSMLAGERFTDRPVAVSPVVAAFARGYNDACRPHERQALYTWAAQALGSRASGEVELTRERLLYLVARSLRTKLSFRRGWREVTWRPLPEPPLRDFQRGRFAAQLAAALVRRPDGHAITVALFEALLAIGSRDPLEGEVWFAGAQIGRTTGSFS